MFVQKQQKKVLNLSRKVSSVALHICLELNLPRHSCVLLDNLNICRHNQLLRSSESVYLRAVLGKVCNHDCNAPKHLPLVLQLHEHHEVCQQPPLQIRPKYYCLRTRIHFTLFQHNIWSLQHCSVVQQIYSLLYNRSIHHTWGFDLPVDILLQVRDRRRCKPQQTERGVQRREPTKNNKMEQNNRFLKEVMQAQSVQSVVQSYQRCVRVINLLLCAFLVLVLLEVYLAT